MGGEQDGLWSMWKWWMTKYRRSVAQETRANTEKSPKRAVQFSMVSENSGAKYATIIGLSVYPSPTQPSFVYAVSTLPINCCFFFFFFQIAFVARGIVMHRVLPWRRGLEKFSRAEKLWVAPNLLAAPLPPKPSPTPSPTPIMIIKTVLAG